MGYMTIRVVRDEYGEEKEVEGARVCVGFDGISRGMSDEEYTDSDGEVSLGDYDDGSCTVYVDGDDMGTYYFQDGATVTISLD